MKQSEQSSSGGGLKALLIVSLLVNVVLAVGLFMLYSKTTQQEEKIATLKGEVTNKDAEVVSRTQELENIKLDLERIKEERERLGLENDSLDQQILALNGHIGQLKKTSSLNSGQRKELEKLIAGLRTQIIEKEKQISELSLANDSLSTGITHLNEDKKRLADSLAQTTSALAYAAILKAENVKIAGLKENGKEFDGEELKGSRIDRLKVTFTLADNKAAKKNKKGMFVALTTPSGEIFSDPNNGGGMLKMADGTEALYTLNDVIDFDNSNQQLNFTMLKGFNYTPGTYKITIYSEGYVIGEGNFKVK